MTFQIVEAYSSEDLLHKSWDLKNGIDSIIEYYRAIGVNKAKKEKMKNIEMIDFSFLYSMSHDNYLIKSTFKYEPC